MIDACFANELFLTLAEFYVKVKLIPVKNIVVHSNFTDSDVAISYITTLKFCEKVKIYWTLNNII